MRYTLLFITFTILIFSNCKREPDILCVENNKELPAITRSGQYTFGCIINGKNWVAYTDQFQQWLGSTEKIICHLNQNNDFSILASIRIENEECDTISQSFTFGALNVSLGENEISYNGKFLDFIPGGCTYKIDTTKSHILNLLEIDTVNEIVSGTFEFAMISEDCLDAINVTDGRFDTKYRGY